MSNSTEAINWRQLYPGKDQPGGAVDAVAELGEEAGDDDDILVIDTDVVGHVVRKMLAAIRRIGTLVAGNADEEAASTPGERSASVPPLEPSATAACRTVPTLGFSLPRYSLRG